MAPFFAALGVAATVTLPGEAAIETAGIWVFPTTEAVPVGGELQRQEPKKVMSLPRHDEEDANGTVVLVGVARVPTGTVIVAAERRGAAERTWRVDGFEYGDADQHRVVLVPINEDS